MGAGVYILTFVIGGGGWHSSCNTLLQYLQYGSKYRKYHVIIFIVRENNSN